MATKRIDGKTGYLAPANIPNPGAFHTHHISGLLLGEIVRRFISTSLSQFDSDLQSLFCLLGRLPGQFLYRSANQ